MPNTYTQLYVHAVFAVKGRANLISPKWKEKLYQYITGIITNKNQKLMVINGMPDHLHLLIRLKPDCTLSDLIRDIKANSSKWINEQKFVMGKFEWQTGFGAFTIGQSQIQSVVNYILNQEEHHKKKTFREEYIEFLNAYEIDYKPEYIFEDVGVAPTELNESNDE
ncbi:MAG TPA: IS200/IS605 family transposase [Chitinophagales bacterium]|nr:IS200/IS605 family transposase [Chitinophagales bacterium]HRK28431.1 IS200/IS605 family transposase [Chitinophagales bacterium]